jgi:hypothetical protein
LGPERISNLVLIVDAGEPQSCSGIAMVSEIRIVAPLRQASEENDDVDELSTDCENPPLSWQNGASTS